MPIGVPVSTQNAVLAASFRSGTFGRVVDSKHRQLGGAKRCGWRQDMDGPNPKSTVSIGGHPVHPMLVPFPIVFFVSTLATDIAYAKTSNVLWATAGVWLLGAGLVMAALAALAGLGDF